jgi:hypothetical protein
VDDAVAKALKRKRELQAELVEIEQFLKLHRRFSGAPADAYRENIADTNIQGTIDHDAFVSVFYPHLKQRGRPADFADLAEDILRRAERPMRRGELVQEIEARGTKIPSADKQRYIGTILWRSPERFINLESFGYWLRNEPCAEVGYDPTVFVLSHYPTERTGEE